jgi:glutathione-regulated potassium-efflux system ancillary protein KefG
LSTLPLTRRPSLHRRTEPAAGASVLVLFCHPMPHRSRLNRRLVEAVRGMPGVTVHDLYEAYPDFGLDVEREQELLALHRVIVFQHPFYWYSTPALLKEWQDQVLTFGWAYGPGGTALRGKTLLSAVTTGGPAQAYRPEGIHGSTVRALLAPIAQTARLCGMRYPPPLVFHSSLRLDEEAIRVACLDYQAVLQALVEDRLAEAPTEEGQLDVPRAVGAGLSS